MCLYAGGTDSVADAARLVHPTTATTTTTTAINATQTQALFHVIFLCLLGSLVQAAAFYLLVQSSALHRQA